MKKIEKTRHCFLCFGIKEERGKGVVLVFWF